MPTTPRLSSFRRSVARLARERGAEKEDDGWVHGGKYVPAQRRPGGPAATPTSATTNGSVHRANGPESGGSRGGASAGGSPYTNISLSPLDTPHPDESMEAPSTGASHRSSQSTASQDMSTRTPQTDQLQRMLGPTPQATPTNDSLLATPENSQVGQLLLSPTTPVGKFLQQSGVPAEASNAIGDAATKVYDTLFALAVVVWNILTEWWLKVVANNLPDDLVPDVLETIGEFGSDVFHFVCQVAKFLSPFALWVLQTLIALALMIGSGLIWGAIYFMKGNKDEADGSRAGEVQSSALKSLRESMRSPFFRRSGRRLPFTGFSDGLADENDAGRQPAQQSAATTASQPRSNRSTPATVSAMRNNARQTPHPASISSSRKSTPATARRVLFSETEAGGVSTEQFTYDKHMPASARKEAHRQTEQNEGGGLVQGGLGVNGMTATTSPAAATAPSATPENKILRSPKYTESPVDSSKSTAQKEPVKVPRQPTPHPNKTSTKSEEELREEAERQKQQYTERYGLLPNITPLSQRYAQMKQRQQQQGKKPLAIDNGPSTNRSAASDSATDAAGVGGKRNVGANAKRKRRGDLLGAASRLGRNRRARLGAAGSNLPTVLLHRPAATKRRRDDAGLSATDEWVWRAMNKDGKENRSNDLASEASAAKRGKFAAGGEAAVGTPPKTDATPTTLPPAMTPPKTPGPSNFSLGSATPAPKKFSAADAAASATPKPKLPFSLGEDGGGGKATFSFGAKTNDSGATTTAEKKDAPAAGFSFGKTTAAAPAEKKDTAAASGTAFAFNASTPATAAPATGGKEEPASGGFAFNASAPATAEKKDGAASTPAFAFGNTASASASSAGPSVAPGFSFGSAGGGTTTTPASAAPTPATTAAPASAGAQFSFGAPPTATATPATAGATPTTAPFAFGTAAQPTPATQPKEATPAGTFAFGTTAAPAAGAAQPSTFAFGAGAATTPAAAPAFGGLGATPAANSFSIGGAGTTSGGGGASARRRAAKASGRRR